MNDAELYQKSNSLQKRDALECLEEYARKIKWKKDASVIDIGCGDGSVTTAILKKFLPNCKEVVGCDISEKMVQYANKKYSSENVSFMVLDIEGDLPDQIRGEFHHAFSFYTLHWIKEQEFAFRNIYDLLKEGGNCFLIFLGHMPLFDVFRILARSSRWSYWLRDLDKFVSPYHDCQDPEKEIRRMMCKIGFTNVEVQYKPKSFIYNSLEAVKKAVKAVNPFEISEELHEELLEDYIGIVRDMQLIDDNVENSVAIRTNYNLIIAYGENYEAYVGVVAGNSWKSMDTYYQYFAWNISFELQRDPEKQIREMLSKIGFIEVELQYKLIPFEYESMKVIRGGIRAITPFGFPEDLFDDFLDDLFYEM